MKLATYVFEGHESFGVVRGSEVADVPTAWPDGPADLLAALSAGTEAMARIAEVADDPAARLDCDRVRLLSPLPRPPKLMGLALNYVAHHAECSPSQQYPDDPSRTTTPRPFLMPSTAVAAHGDEIPWPRYSRQIDHEIELAIVIGSQARCVSEDQAMKHIAGYTIANDISARTATFAENRRARPKDEFFDWLHSKWSDGFCPLGPVMVTADEIADPTNLDMELTVNGEVRQKANTSLMIHKPAQIVSFVSHIMTLSPGDVIATGTPAGVGMASGKFLAGGDTITCRIEGIGELTNTLGSEPERFYVFCP